MINVANFQVLDRSKIIQHLTLELLSSLRNIYHSTTAYFFDPPCINVGLFWCPRPSNR